MALPQVWSKRQEVQQWALTGPAPMKEVGRMNAVVVQNPLQGQEERKNEKKTLCNGYG